MNMTRIGTWVATAKRGERFAYHVSTGPEDQVCGLRCIQREHRTDAQCDALAEAFDAWALYAGRLVTLVQRRVGEGLQYEAVRL